MNDEEIKLAFLIETPRAQRQIAETALETIDGPSYASWERKSDGTEKLASEHIGALEIVPTEHSRDRNDPSVASTRGARNKEEVSARRVREPAAMASPNEWLAVLMSHLRPLSQPPRMIINPDGWGLMLRAELHG